jgi:hypothetical protein
MAKVGLINSNLIICISSFFYLEKESPSYAEVSLEETPITATTQSISSSGLRSTGSIRHENSTHQTTTTTIKTDDIIIPTTFT